MEVSHLTFNSFRDAVNIYANKESCLDYFDFYIFIT